MFGLILASSMLLSFLIDLSLWQSVVAVLFCACVFITGRMIGNE